MARNPTLLGCYPGRPFYQRLSGEPATEDRSGHLGNPPGWLLGHSRSFGLSVNRP